MFGERLKLARKRAGLSLRDLEVQINYLVTAQAIGKYERNEMLPSSTVAIALAKTLDVPMSFLFSPSKIHIEKIVFRTSHTIRPRERSLVESLVLDHVDRYLLIEELLDMGGVGWDKPIGAPFYINSLNEIDKVANEIRKIWNLGLGPIANVTEMLEEHGIKIIKLDFPLSVDGLSCEAVIHNKKNTPIIVASIGKSNEEQRFTLAHELAHVLLTIDPTIDEEIACDRFAAAFLLPKDSISQEMGDSRHALSYTEIIDIKQFYGVSAETLISRLNCLGIISDSLKLSIFRGMGKDWRKQEPVSMAFCEFPKRFRRLVLRGLTEDIISVSKAAELLDLKTNEIQKIISGP